MRNVFDPTTFGAVFVTLFVIMDPLGSIPLFLGLTGGRTPRTRTRLAGQAVLVSLFVITLFAIVVNVALVPLGTPLLAGPGAIVATIVFVQQAEGLPDVTAIAAGIVAIHLAVYLALRFSVGITRIIKESGIVLLTRIAGLLLSAIAVQLVAESVMGFIAEAG